MVRSLFQCCAAVLLGAAATAPGMAQAPGLSARCHPWGRFDPGAWKTYRVISETLNEQGQVVGTSTTDATAILLDIDNEGVTLEIQTCMEVAGKRFDAEPQTLKQGFHGEAAAPNLKVSAPSEGSVTIEDRKIPCQVQHFESNGPNGKCVTTVYYSPTVAPYILKRETVSTDPDGKTNGGETRTTYEVLLLNMPRRILGETRNGAYVRTVYQSAKGVVTTLAFVVPEVPGGVVEHSSKEIDKNGRLVRRTTLSLVEYEAAPFHDRGEPPRKRPPRRDRGKSTLR